VKRTSRFVALAAIALGMGAAGISTESPSSTGTKVTRAPSPSADGQQSPAKRTAIAGEQQIKAVRAARPWRWGSVGSAGNPPDPRAWKHNARAERTRCRKAKAKARRRRMKGVT
jgi:hypothetical protein